MSTINSSTLAEDVYIDLGDLVTASGALDYIDKSIRRVNRKLHFVGTGNEITVTSGVITAPSDDVIDILTLQVECLAVKTAVGTAVSKGIDIKSGQDAIKTDNFAGYKDITNSVCNELNEAIKDYLAEGEKGDREALLDGYGKLIWHGSQNLYIDADFNGDYEKRLHPFTSLFDDEDAQDL